MWFLLHSPRIKSRTAIPLRKNFAARSAVLERLIEAGDPSLADVIEDLIAYEVSALKRFREPGQPFSLMACQLTDGFLATL